MKIKMPNGWRTIKSLEHKIRLHSRRGKGMAESFSGEKLRHAPQKEGGWETLCDLPPVWPRLVRPTNLMSRMNGKKTQKTHICLHLRRHQSFCGTDFSCCGKLKFRYNGLLYCWAYAHSSKTCSTLAISDTREICFLQHPHYNFVLI